MGNFNFQPVIIVGAPRSGTNMLRDILCSFQGVATWPCDEINYIWRHGNIKSDTDAFSAKIISPAVKSYIRNQFSKMARHEKCDFLVEKTCANSLRVPFVDAVIPEAKYIFIVRDGIDAAGSARIRWKAKIDIKYIIEKAFFVPVSDLPYYGVRYIWSRLHRLLSKDKRLAFWGPALDNMQDIIKERSLSEVCAIQWQQCVDESENAFSSMPDNKVIHVRYEDFVKCPEEELYRILEFIGKKDDYNQIVKAVECVSTRSIGKGRKALDINEVAALESLVGGTLKRYDYL